MRFRDTTHVGLAKHDDMVGALAAEAWARSTCHGCPLFVVGTSRRCRKPDLDLGSGNVDFIPGKCLRDLICDPLRDRMRCYVDLDKIVARQPDDDESVEQLKSDARNRQQVHGGDWCRVVAKEGKPSLQSGRGSLSHVLRRARRSDFETELQ